MGKIFLDLLKRYNSPAEIKEEEISEIIENFYEFLDYIKNKDRDEEDLIPVCTKLKELAAPIESYKIMKEDAEYYRFYGEYDKYYNRLYYAYAYAVLGYPTIRMEKELKDIIEKVREYRNGEYFLPLFLNVLGNIYHIYREKYEEAESLYEEALQFLLNLKKEKYYNITGRDYNATFGLVVNNYIDTILKVEIDENKEKKLLELEDLLRKIDKSGYIDILSELNKAEILIKRDKLDDGEKVIKNLLRDLKPDFSRYVLPAANRMRAIIHYKKGNTKDGIDYAIKSFANSSYYGNTLCEKETLFTILEIFDGVMKKNNEMDKREFLKINGFVDTVIDILSYKDWNLGAEHSANVAQIAKLISLYMKLDEESVKVISFAGILHDIGKIMIPNFTLNKTEELDSVDWDIIKAHVEEGYRILKRISLDKEAQIVYEHHERIDGSGYPRGTKKPLLESQIVAVGDVFDAAVSYGRKYKKKKSYEEIFEELKNKQGYEFYPEVLNALWDVLPSM
uniref:HD domain-containing protein n=1 Tax=candidate division WOR-3 bacterium TaxID=2052148 RepID=A0A7C4YGA1_UNCW3